MVLLSAFSEPTAILSVKKSFFRLLEEMILRVVIRSQIQTPLDPFYTLRVNHIH